MISNYVGLVPIYLSLIDKIQAHRLSMIELGGFLKTAKYEEPWLSEIGDGIDTWFDFIQQPEIGLSASEAKFLMDLFDYAQQHGVGEMSRVPTATAKYMIKHGGDTMDGQLLTTKDFKRKYFEDKKGKTADHKYAVMKIFEDGTMSRVYGEELQEAKKQIDE